MRDLSINKNSLIINDPRFKLLSGMPKPEFMLIGGAKCGTTSFAYYLSAHPQIKESKIKEPNYWSWKLCNKAQYQSLFVNSAPLLTPRADQKIGGEYSTSSLLHPLVPRRVRGRLPNIKLIVLLRNPIDRAYSHYIMSQRQGMEPTRSFDEIIEKEIDEVPVLLEAHQRGFLDSNFRTQAHRSTPQGKPITVVEHNEHWTPHPLYSDQELFRFYGSSYVFRSLYHDQLWRWLQLFSREQMLIIQSEQFMAEREKIMNQVVQFLGLQTYSFSPDELQNTWGGGASNLEKPGDYPPISNKTRTLLQSFFAPHNQKLFDLLGQSFDWD